MVRFGRVIFGVILGLGLTIGALSAASVRLGPTVDSVTTARVLDGTSVSTQIAVTFTEPMNIVSVEHSFHLRPRVAGDFSWEGNQLLYVPRKNLAYSTTYALTIDTGARGRSGKHLFKTYRATFTTQSQHLLYRGTAGNERNRLVLASLDGKREVVGSTDGTVADFSASWDRSLVVYVKYGTSHERADEIWLLSLSDNSTQRILRRPDWTISQPHLSPDNRFVVFLATNVLLCHKYYGCYRDRSAPVVYRLDLRSRKLSPFSSSDVPITNFIEFSPAGQVAYTDLGSALTLADPAGSHVVHIPDDGNSLEFAGFDAAGDKAVFVGQTPDSSGGDVLVYDRGKYLDVSHGVYDSSTPALSNSGKAVAYSAYRTELDVEPVYGINTYDLTRHATQKLTSERVWSDWNPEWSPDDRYIAFVRSRPREAMYMGSGSIWVVPAAGGKARSLGDSGEDLQWVS